MEVVLATHNAHKVREFQSILGAALPELRILAYDGPQPVEDGVSFAENALIKARTAAAATGRPAMADDSGICVDVLGGAPGIFSALWSGTHGDDAANRALLLAQLADIRPENRRASFHCSIAVVGAPGDGREEVVEGIWPGAVAAAERGGAGFGYDPVFVPDGFDGLTSAELTAEQKNAHSHRARAFEKVIPLLARFA